MATRLWYFTRAPPAPTLPRMPMTSGPERTAKTDVEPRRIAARCLLMLAAAFCQAGVAAEVPLYKVTVPLKGGSEAERNAALGDALRVVVVRASGRRDAAANAAVDASAARANRLVQQYSATPDQQLKVGFEATTIDGVLHDAGLPAWPSERPLTLVLLPSTAAASGGRVLRTGESSPERTQLEQAALARGVPLAWPVAETSVDVLRAQLDASGVEGAARAAGTSADAVLLGRPAGEQIEWTLVHAGDSSQRRGSAADGAHLAADSYASLYATAATRGLTTVSVRIDGVESLQAYAGLMQVLESLSLVREIAVSEVDRATVRLTLTLRGDLELLRRVAMLTPSLRPATTADPAGPQFVYLP